MSLALLSCPISLRCWVKPTEEWQLKAHRASIKRLDFRAKPNWNHTFSLAKYYALSAIHTRNHICDSWDKNQTETRAKRVAWPMPSRNRRKILQHLLF